MTIMNIMIMIKTNEALMIKKFYVLNGRIESTVNSRPHAQTENIEWTGYNWHIVISDHEPRVKKNTLHDCHFNNIIPTSAASAGWAGVRPAALVTYCRMAADCEIDRPSTSSTGNASFCKSIAYNYVVMAISTYAVVVLEENGESNLIDRDMIDWLWAFENGLINRWVRKQWWI